MVNTLYYGDNLKVLRDSIRSEPLVLIFLDPPFKSNASYSVLFNSPQGQDAAAQIHAFDDWWHPDESAFCAAAREKDGFRQGRLNP